MSGINTVYEHNQWAVPAEAQAKLMDRMFFFCNLKKKKLIKICSCSEKTQGLFLMSLQL